MWADYNAFYRADVSETATAATWRRILDAQEPFGAVLAIDAEVPLGFANFVLHPYTWSEHLSCLLEDLYVVPQARGRGVGRKLIQWLLDRGRSEGWTKVFWMTEETNLTARRLYDAFTPPDGFIQYTVSLD